MTKHLDSIDAAILARARSRGPGVVLTSRDFLDLGRRDAVLQALSRNARAGNLRRLARGLYEVPRVDPTLGSLPTHIEAVVMALAARHSLRLQPYGANAAHLLGLTDQVPVHAVFLTDGVGRKIRIGKRTITLKRAAPRQLATAGRVSGLVIQALRWIGRPNVDDRIVRKLRARLDDDDKRILAEDIAHAPEWIAQIVRKLVADEEVKDERVHRSRRRPPSKAV